MDGASAPTINDATIQDARTRQRLSAIIGRVVKLRRVGPEYEGLCPFHDDRDPSLNVNDEKAVWTCRAGCGGGDAITFIMRQYGKTFREAVLELAGAPFESSASAFDRKFREAAEEYATRPNQWEPDARERANIAEAQRLWNNAIAARGTIAHDYLRRARAISIAPPPSLRFVPTLPFWHVPEGAARATVAGHFPVLLAGLQAPKGATIAVQRIYLAPDGSGKAPFKKPKKTLAPMQNAAVRLGAAGQVIGIAEGIETGLSAQQIYSIPVWVSCGATRMRDVWLPPQVEEVMIFRDNGEAGLAEAIKAADVFEDQGRRVMIEPPPKEFGDWNDVLKARRSGK